MQEAKVASVMGAYNRVNGESASASPRFLGQILRKEWGFDGYVVSDCGSIDDIFVGHKIVKTAEEAAALAVKEGCDLECGTIYRSLKTAVEQEADHRAGDRRRGDAARSSSRFKLGMFDPPERVQYAQTPFSVNEAPAHDQLAREMAQASVVLLKNTGVLPLAANTRTIAVIGPNADEVMTLVGNYYGTPSKPVTLVQGIRNAVPGGEGALRARRRSRRGPPGSAGGAADSVAVPAPGGRLDRAGPQGRVLQGKELQGTPVLTRVDRAVSFRWDRLNPTDRAGAPGPDDARAGARQRRVLRPLDRAAACRR